MKAARSHLVLAITGEDGYEGLTAVVEFTHPRGINSEVRGFICEGPLPPEPSVAIE